MKAFEFFRRRVATAFCCWFATCLVSADLTFAQELAPIGIAGPSRVMLTPKRTSATKPVAVVIENRATTAMVIPDLASLRNLVGLEVETLTEIPAPKVVLAPPKNFPITLPPRGRLSVVFRVKFELGDSAPGAIEVRYRASVPRATSSVATAADSVIGSVPGAAAPGITVSSGAAVSGLTSSSGASSIIRRGMSNGATVTAKPMRAALKPGKTSEPISFSAKWPGKSFYVSGWESTPADPEADPIFEKARGSSVTARWKNPGTYTVTVYLIHNLPGGGFEQAAPNEQVHVISVEFQDENGGSADGMKIGVSTRTDRSRVLKAIVTPASEVNHVTLKITKGTALNIKEQTPGSGVINFTVEGIGQTGSGKTGETIEAQVEGKEAGSVNVKVVVPKFLEKQIVVMRDDHNFLAYQSDGKHAGSSPNLTGSPVYPMAQLATFYGFLVKIPVTDQNHEPIDGPHLYGGADVVESIGAIHRTIQSGSFYLDPAGFLGRDWNPARAPVNVNSPAAMNFVNAPPLFPYPPKLQNIPFFGNAELDVPAFTVTVDGFPCMPPIKRKLTVQPNGDIVLTQTP